MTFNPVASSMIAAVGYDPDLSIVAVRFHGGNTAVHGNVSRDEYVAFMSAESKGRHYNAVIAQKPKLDLAGSTKQSTSHIELREPEPLAPLETFAEDACCSSRLQRAKRDGLNQWECPKCGSAWRRQILAGGMSHWAPFTDFFVVRPGR